MIEVFFLRVKENIAVLAGNMPFELNKKAFLGLFFIAVGIAMAILIVWQPAYFLVILAAVLFLIVVFWKTEEALILLVFYLPFQIALNISSSIDLASSRLFVVILFLAWFIKSLAKKKLGIPYGLTAWFLGIFLGLILLSVYFSIDQEKSIVRSLFFLSLFPLYFVASDYLRSTGKILRALYTLLISAGIAALAGIGQFLSQFVLGIDAIMDFWAKNIAYLFYGQSFGKVIITNPSWLVNVGGKTFFRAISFFPDPHMFAFYLGLIAPVFLSLALFSNVFRFTFWQKSLLYGGNCIVFFALGLTFSRAGYVGAFFGVLAVVLIGWRFFAKRIKFAIVVLVLAGGIVFFNSSSTAGGIIISRFFSSFNPAEGSNSARLLNWKQAAQTIEKHPVFGVGVGAYAEAVSVRAPERSSITAHNTYLDIAAEMGIFALIVWAVILLFTVKKFLLIALQKNYTLSREIAISIGLVGAFIWFSVQMVFDTAIYSPVLLAILMVYFAISDNLGKENN